MRADDIRAAARLYAGGGNAAIYYGLGVTEHSQGSTMVMAMASLFSNRPVRGDVGMTGEVTLRGRVLPVGGIKMKILAAHRAGLKTVILPKRNEKDLEEEKGFHSSSL